MAEQTTFVEITDGDQLSEGYFNELGVFSSEKANSAGALTHSSSGFSLKQTFTFPTLLTNYELIALELDDITLSDSSANSNDNASMGIIITDGSTYWSPGGYDDPLDFDSTSYVMSPQYISTVSSGAPEVFIRAKGGGGTSHSADHISIPITSGTITGATSLDVEFYLSASQTASNTATLAGGFTVRLLFRKRAPRDLGITPTQA